MAKGSKDHSGSCTTRSAETLADAEQTHYAQQGAACAARRRTRTASACGAGPARAARLPASTHSRRRTRSVAQHAPRRWIDANNRSRRLGPARHPRHGTPHGAAPCGRPGRRHAGARGGWRTMKCNGCWSENEAKSECAATSCGHLFCEPRGALVRRYNCQRHVTMCLSTETLRPSDLEEWFVLAVQV